MSKSYTKIIDNIITSGSAQRNTVQYLYTLGPMIVTTKQNCSVCAGDLFNSYNITIFKGIFLIVNGKMIRVIS